MKYEFVFHEIHEHCLDAAHGDVVNELVGLVGGGGACGAALERLYHRSLVAQEEDYQDCRGRLPLQGHRHYNYGLVGGYQVFPGLVRFPLLLCAVPRHVCACVELCVIVLV